MASPYIMTNADLQHINCAGQDFNLYLAFNNPVAIQTSWSDLNMDASGNWQPPANVDTIQTNSAPYIPVANIGPNRIGFVNEPLFFDGSRSYQRFDLPVPTDTGQWITDGPYTMTPYANGTQVSISWSNPGTYIVVYQFYLRRLVPGSYVPMYGVAKRQVKIYQDRQSALPGVISISGLSGSLSTGGWQMQCTTTSSQVSLYNPDVLPPGTYQPVVLMAETKYEVAPGQWANMTLGPHGHFNPGEPYIDSRILFDGYVQSGSVHQDIDKDTLSFSCVGPQMVLQEAKSHMLGYYNCQYTSLYSGSPQGLKPSPVGNGYQVGGLQTADVIHSLLQDHCTLSTYHDMHIWNANIPVNPYSNTTANAAYNLIYTTLSVNEGTIWQNLQDLASNEYAQLYCERDGSIRCGPQVNYRGGDYWLQPTLLGAQVAPYLINYVQDQGYTVSSSLDTIAGSFPILPAQPYPVYFVHPWGHQPNPPQYLAPFSSPNSQIQQTQAGLVGPPILCTFSDVPIYDTGSVPPDTNVLFPWIVSNWPQDLAVYPLSIDLQENYTGRATLVKLIGTLYGHSTLWTSWYPQNTFKLVGDGTVSVVTSVLPASDWVLNESHVIADVTTQQQQNLVWNWWWEIARREYYARNMNYTASITTPMFTSVSLGDVVGITRQNTTLGPRFLNKPFYVQEISHNIDLSSRTWTTSLALMEVTSANLGSVARPPNKPPKG